MSIKEMSTFTVRNSITGEETTYTLVDEQAREDITDLKENGVKGEGMAVGNVYTYQSPEGSSPKVTITKTDETNASGATLYDFTFSIPKSAGGVTTEQANSLWSILQKTAFATQLTSAEISAFKTAWGIDGSVTPDIPVEPDIPEEVTLTSISATYTGGNVATGTAVTDLTDITVTATYSDGTTQTVTGYTLSGDIVEGENTITVSYGGKTTTFTVTGIVESGSGDVTAELITDGLLDYFDFRTAEYNNEGAGNSTLIYPTQGNGQLYAWAKNVVTEQSADYGMLFNSLSYATDKSTTQASCGTAFTWVYKTRYKGKSSSPIASGDYCNASNMAKLEWKPKYNTTSGATAQVATEKIGTRASEGYELVVIVVDGNICKLYIGNELIQENDGSVIEGFASWYDKLSCRSLNGAGMVYASQLVIYNRALSEVELTELTAYLETLEVA